MRKAWMAAPALAMAGLAWWIGAQASDHDDGETDTKGRNVNLTDLYVFREGDQTGVPADNSNLILIMNSNPRSIPRQQYFFSTNARYEFHLSRQSAVDNQATGADDVTLRFEFGAPDAQGRQAISVTAIRDGVTLTGGGAATLTTPIGTAPVNNSVSLGGTDLTVFAGLREEPFFFDVESFFQTRATGTVQLKPAATAVDGFAGYNVNSIVVRVPIAFLQSAGIEQVFDVWETISVRN